MKAILEFNLPEDRDEHIHAINGSDYKAALEDLRNAFREKKKYGKPETTWDEAYELFWDTLKEAGIELD